MSVRLGPLPPVQQFGAVVARMAHNHEVAGSNPAAATKFNRYSGDRQTAATEHFSALTLGWWSGGVLQGAVEATKPVHEKMASSKQTRELICRRCSNLLQSSLTCRKGTDHG